MKKKLLCLLLAVLMLITVVAAAEKPKTSVDTFRRCSLTLQYAASGQTVRLYRVARISHSGNHTLQGVFAGYGIHLPAGNSQAEWDALRDTLHAYILADAIAPDYTATTGTDGKAVCAGLPVGMYLVDGVDMEVGSEVYQYAAALLSVPGADTLSGFISRLDAGEHIYFTDVQGVRYAFTVSKIAHRTLVDLDELQAAGSPLSLFAKKGSTYFVVQCTPS